MVNIGDFTNVAPSMIFKVEDYDLKVSVMLP
jgi:hypothetical protein